MHPCVLQSSYWRLLRRLSIPPLWFAVLPPFVVVNAVFSCPLGPLEFTNIRWLGPVLFAINTQAFANLWGGALSAVITLLYMFGSQFALRKLCQLESAPTKTSVNAKLISRYYFLVVVNTIVGGILWSFIYISLYKPLYQRSIIL